MSGQWTIRRALMISCMGLDRLCGSSTEKYRLGAILPMRGELMPLNRRIVIGHSLASFPDDIATANEWDHRPFPDLLAIRLLSFKAREIWRQLRRPLARQRQEFVPYRVGVPLDLGYAGKSAGSKYSADFMPGIRNCDETSEPAAEFSRMLCFEAIKARSRFLRQVATRAPIGHPLEPAVLCRYAGASRAASA